MSNDPFLTALGRMGLLQPGECPAITPLTGGVSSDIVRVDLRSGPICVKRALPKLKVQAAVRQVRAAKCCDLNGV